MDLFLSTVKMRYVLVYPDDIVIFCGFSSEHIAKVLQALNLLRNAEIIIRLKKCSLFNNTIDYLGNVIRARRLEIASQTTDGIKN